MPDRTRALKMPAVKERFESMGADIVANTPVEAKAMLVQQLDMYGTLVEELGIEIAN